MELSKIRQIDAGNMYDVLKGFPDQVRSAVEIGSNAPAFNQQANSYDLLVLGMGGSAIGGDLLRSLCNSVEGLRRISLRVSRGYDLPGNVDKGTCVLASSYSGGTEETIASTHQALGITSNIISLTTGGELEKLSIENSIPIVRLPTGLMPRCALGYSFFPMLEIALVSASIDMETINGISDAKNELTERLDERSKVYSDPLGDNCALSIARRIVGKIPIVYSSADRLDSVNLRFRCQIQENSKNLAFGNLLPEMNHNEITGWENPAHLIREFIFIFLRDRDDHPKVKIRFDALGEILTRNGSEIISLEGTGSHILTRMFDLVYLADWVSFWLAMLSRVDPTPIPAIQQLKSYLSGKT